MKVPSDYSHWYNDTVPSILTFDVRARAATHGLVQTLAGKVGTFGSGGEFHCILFYFSVWCAVSVRAWRRAAVCEVLFSWDRSLPGCGSAPTHGGAPLCAHR